MLVSAQHKQAVVKLALWTLCIEREACHSGCPQDGSRCRCYGGSEDLASCHCHVTIGPLTISILRYEKTGR